MSLSYERYLKQESIENMNEVSQKLNICKDNIDSLLSRIEANDYSQGEFEGKNHELYMESIGAFVAIMKKSGFDVLRENTLRINNHIHALKDQIQELQIQIRNSSVGRTGR